MASVKKLLAPFLKSNTYWYIPRAFWPYASEPEGIPNFHEFMRLLTKRQKWDRKGDIKILESLRSKGFLPDTLDQAEDYHVHYRNRINFAKKLGFIKPSGRALTNVGGFFAKAPETRWPEIFEHQLIKWQFTNPTLPKDYDVFRLFPYIFTLSVISEVEGNFITLDEFVLRVSLSQNQAEKDEVIEWISNFRSLSDTDRETMRSQINLVRQYAGRMLTLLFGYTPSLGFHDNILTISDLDRIAFVLGRAQPHLTLRTYTPNAWDKYFGSFDSTFWPLIPRARVIKQRKRQYKRYVKREGSSEHSALKRYVIDNAEALFGSGTKLFQEEYYFPSSDKANLAFILPDGKWLTVEVEVDVPPNDIVGLLQAIKYKYMCAVQERLKFDQIRTALVAHSVDQTIKDMCSIYDVEVYEVEFISSR